MYTNKQITDALLRLIPGAQWTLAGDDYSNISWHCECVQPTLEEIELEIAKEPEIAAAKATQRQAILDRLGLTAEEAALLLGGN